MISYRTPDRAVGDQIYDRLKAAELRTEPGVLAPGEERA
jgi:hypothetical protein